MKAAATEVGARMERIADLVAAIEASSDPDGRAAARELCASLLEVHAAGLRKLLDLVSGAGEAGRAIADAGARDESVAAMLAIHELGWKLPAPAAKEQLIQLRIPAREESPVERCDLCGAVVAEAHAHLLELHARKLACTCEACAMLLGDARAGSDASAAPGGAARYRRVPRRVRPLDDFRMSDAQWDALGVPVRLAFFVRRSPEGAVAALYPSPAGALESAPPSAAWDEIAAQNPALGDMEPDVEALLVHRIGDASDHLVVPIDRCFELTGLLRSHRGAIVWWAPGDGDGKVRGFVAKLRQEAR